jgi:hypothetical protein
MKLSIRKFHASSEFFSYQFARSLHFFGACTLAAATACSSAPSAMPTSENKPPEKWAACGRPLPPSSGVPANIAPPPAPPEALRSVAAESGFIEVPAQATANTSPARMFYVFQPAEEAPETKPLFVIFNGGPGSPTTMGLLGYGTGKYTLDEANPTASLRRNPAPFTELGNLLYIDQRDAGFSYSMTRDPKCVFDGVEDAADFLRVVLRFLAARPTLQRNNVVILAESYGGLRAQFMLDMLFHATSDGCEAAAPGIGREVVAHFATAFPGEASPGVLPKEVIARQFGQQVLIQPVATGDAQDALQEAIVGRDPLLRAARNDAFAGKVSPYHSGKPTTWTDSLQAGIRLALSTEDSALALGVDLARMAGLRASERGMVVRPPEKDPDHPSLDPALEQALTSKYGQLQPGDGYYSLRACTGKKSMPAGQADLFSRNLRYVRTFITNAAYDTVIHTPAIAPSLASFGIVREDPTAPLGARRPGNFEVDLPEIASEGLPPVTASVRIPKYAESGHMVPATEGAALRDDIAEWLAR